MNDVNENYFTMVKRGYDPDEVRAYIEELESKCSYLQARNTELEQKLDTARRLIRRFSGMENELRQNIADSKRAAASMLSDTQSRSDALLDKTRESCGEMISDLDMQISQRMGTIDVMKAAVATFKDQLFEMYSSHIELIEALSQNAESFEYEPDYSKVAEAVDAFETADEAKCEMPEFGDYPKEGIFSEFEGGENSFVIDDNGTNGSDEEFDPDQQMIDVEPKADTDDMKSEDDAEGRNTENNEQNENSGEADGDENENGEDFTVNVTYAEAENDSEDKRSDDDYFRFLSEFANGDGDGQ